MKNCITSDLAIKGFTVLKVKFIYVHKKHIYYGLYPRLTKKKLKNIK